MITRRGILKTLGGALLGAFGFAGYAFSIEPGFRLATARYKLRPQGWPEGMRLRIACISDIHASEPQMGLSRIADVVRRINELKPDIILLLGDYGVGQTIYARPVPTPDVARVLKELDAPLGKFAILGNHDYWGSSLRGWPYTEKKVNDTAQTYRDMLAAADIRLMENDVARLSIGGHAFWLMGTGSMIALPLAPRRFRSFALLDDQLAKLSRICSSRCPGASVSPCRAIPMAGRCACSAIRRSRRPIMATALPMATLPRTGATSSSRGALAPAPCRCASACRPRLC